MEKKERSPAVLLVRKARALLVGATLLWGLSFPLLRGMELAQRVAAPNISDFTLACSNVAARFGLAALFLLPIFGRDLCRVTLREWSQAIGLAFFGGVGTCLLTLGLAWTDASVTAFLTQLYTLIVPLIVAVRDRRLPSLRVVVACGMVLVGAALLSPGLRLHFVPGPGEIVIVIATSFLAAQVVWVERPLYAENRPGLVTLIMFLLLTGMFTLAYAFSGGTVRDVGSLFGTPVLFGITLILVLFCTVFNFLIMNAWQRCVSATEAALIYCVEPVIAATLSSFVPGWISNFAGIAYANETLSWSLLAGGALIVGAAVLVATGKREQAFATG